MRFRNYTLTEYMRATFGAIRFMRFVLDKPYSLKHRVAMNRLSTTKRSQVVAALCEGVSVRATCRMTDVAAPS